MGRRAFDKTPQVSDWTAVLLLFSPLIFVGVFILIMLCVAFWPLALMAAICIAVILGNKIQKRKAQNKEGMEE